MRARILSATAMAVLSSAVVFQACSPLYSAPEIVPSASPPPPPPRPPPPPPAPIQVPVCVVQNGSLAHVWTNVDPATGDTTLAGMPFATAYPAVAPNYAAGQSWYTEGDVLQYGGQRYRKDGPTHIVDAADLRNSGIAFFGVPVFEEAGAVHRAPVVYLPVRPGCEFQPYAPEVLAATAATATAPDAPTRPPSPVPPDPPSPATPEQTVRETIEGLPSGEIRFPHPGRMRQGIGRIISVQIADRFDQSGNPTTGVDTGSGSEPSAPPAVRGFERGDLVETQPIRISSRMKVTLTTDTVGGPAFSISALSDSIQLVPGFIPTTWSWTVVPLRSGSRNLYLQAHALVDTGEGREPIAWPVITRSIPVEVDVWFMISEFFRRHVLPIAVGTLIAMFGGLWKWGSPMLAALVSGRRNSSRSTPAEPVEESSRDPAEDEAVGRS